MGLARPQMRLPFAGTDVAPDRNQDTGEAATPRHRLPLFLIGRGQEKDRTCR